MEPGEFVEEFVAKDGRRITIRAPEMKDVQGYLQFINDLVAEGAPIMLNTPQSYADEMAYTAGKLDGMASGKELAIVATAEGRVIADASIARGRGREQNVGTLGIAVSKQYRNIGLGFEMIRLLLDMAKAEKYRVIVLTVYANNPAAKHLYEKLGFRQTGTIPKAAAFGADLVDSLLMYKEL
ncbi:MAG: GNAT family N-acetyltransferase [Candidatus Micrarchaeia archaeon]